MGMGVAVGAVTEMETVIVVSGFLAADVFASSTMVEQLWCSIVLPTRPPITAATMATTRAENRKISQFGNRLRALGICGGVLLSIA